jgi:hypothetical protein
MTTIGKSILALLVTSGVMGRCQAQTAAATQGSAGAFVGVEGSKLYYEECGTGAEAVVLLHDGIAHSAVWDDVWPTFVSSFMRSVTIGAAMAGLTIAATQKSR